MKECTGVPHVEDELATRGVEGQWLDLGAESWDVELAFQLARDASLYEGGLARTVVPHNHHLEARRRRAIVPAFHRAIGQCCRLVVHRAVETTAALLHFLFVQLSAKLPLDRTARGRRRTGPG